MPSLQDSAFLFILALLLFGPKRLPVLARQLGKLMGEFRRASSEFRSQMEDELRISEQADRQKEIAAIEAAAPKPPAIESHVVDAPVEVSESESHTPPPEPNFASAPEPEALPIATSGELNLMPPSTGLPVANTSLSPLLDSIPHTSENGNSAHAHNSIAAPVAEVTPEPEPEARPWML